MVSERRACRALGQPRSTQRREPKIAEDEDELVARMTQLASEYGRYGYLRITALLRREGWHSVGHRRTLLVGDGPVSRVRCGPVPIHAPTPLRW